MALPSEDIFAHKKEFRTIDTTKYKDVMNKREMLEMVAHTNRSRVKAISETPSRSNHQASYNPSMPGSTRVSVNHNLSFNLHPVPAERNSHSMNPERSSSHFHDDLDRTSLKSKRAKSTKPHKIKLPTNPSFYAQLSEMQDHSNVGGHSELTEIVHKKPSKKPPHGGFKKMILRRKKNTMEE